MRNYFSYIFAMLFAALSLNANNTPKPNCNINHVVITVKSLEKAVKNYRKSGFNVVETGQFGTNFVHNAHIPFITGSYIELFSPVNPDSFKQFQKLRIAGKLAQRLTKANIMNKRFLTHLSYKTGVSDFALETNKNISIEKLVAKLQKHGVKYSGPISMKRITPAKKVMHWIVYVPETTALPFLIHWINNDDIPKSIAEQKKLGIKGIKNVTVAVKNFKMRIEQYSILLGVKPEIVSSNKLPDTNIALFKLNNESITLISPKNPKSPAFSFLKEKKPSPYSITLECTKKTDIPLKLLDDAKISTFYLQQ